MDENTLSGHQFQLFEPPSQTAPHRNYDPESWSDRADISWHASNQPTMPPESDNQGSFGEGFHVGTHKSAEDRATSGSQNRSYIHPVRHTGSMALRDDDEFYPAQKFDDKGETQVDDPRLVFSDMDANYNVGLVMTNKSDEIHEFPGRPQLTIPYVNASEDQGSISYRAPRENLHSWSEDVAADPGASRRDKLTAEHFDLTQSRQGEDRMAYARQHPHAGFKHEQHPLMSHVGREQMPVVTTHDNLAEPEGPGLKFKPKRPEEE